MIVRIWQTRVVPTRTADYERFAREDSLRMFRRQEGCVGVLYLVRDGAGVTLSLWRDEDAVRALAASEDYREVVDRLERSGILAGDQSVQVYDLIGGFLSAADPAWAPLQDQAPSSPG